MTFKKSKIKLSFNMSVFFNIIPIILLKIFICESALTPRPRIIGGVKCKQQDYPFFVSIYGPLNCGGTVITYQWVLTAAHCLEDVIKPTSIIVRSGSYGKQSQVRYGVRIVQHPQFDLNHIQRTFPDLRYDIGLIKVETPFQPGPHMAPVELPKRNHWLSCKKGLVLGKGVVAMEPYQSIMSKDLRCVELHIVNQSVCSETYKGSVIDYSVLCIREDVSGKDAWYGDSGGPILCEESKIIIGIVSFGKECGQAGLAATYTKVEFYLDFIEEIIQETQDYSLLLNIGRSGVRVVGGALCRPEEYPFVVAIFGPARCGGTMLTYEWVLTAAHCLQVKVGELKVRSGFQAKEKFVQERMGKYAVIHQNFTLERLEEDASKLRYDIGLLKVEKPFKPARTMKLVHLPRAGMTKKCTNGLVLGLGVDQFVPFLRAAVENKDPLRCANLHIANNSICKWYEDSLLEDSVVCALEEVEGKDSCSGDSGGPLLCDDTTVIIGIVSYERQCGKGGVRASFTSVEVYLDFINSVITKGSITKRNKFATTTGGSGKNSQWKLFWIIVVSGLAPSIIKVH